MGCCVSTQNEISPHQQQKISTLTRPLQISKSPPRAEEETVKEVLSEAPKPRSKIPKISDINGGGGEERKLSTPRKQTLDFPKRENKSLKVPLLSTVTISTPEDSEASEICSLNESLSTATISEKRKREYHPSQQPEFYEVRKMVYGSPARPCRNGSFSGNLGLKKQNVTGRSPVRRSEPYPGRRNDRKVMPGSNPDPGRGMVRRGLGLNGQRRRDPGEYSGPSSRSPGTRIGRSGAGRANSGQSPSGRKTGPSPTRIRMVQRPPLPAAETTRKVVGEEAEQRRREINKWSTPNESLENHLVSLECFIFL